VKFLFDSGFPPRTAEAIGALCGRGPGTVCHQHDKFPREASDEAILYALAEEGGWTILSADPDTARLRHQRRALRACKVTVFALAPAWRELTLWGQAALLVQRWPSIERAADATEPGATVEIPVNPAAAFRRLGR